MTTKETIENYFNNLSKNDGWQNNLSDSMEFFSPRQNTVGKEHYIEATLRFFQFVYGFEIKELIIDGDKACALVSYQVKSPKGNKSTCEVAEILTVKNGKLQSSKIYFDTAAFQEFISRN